MDDNSTWSVLYTRIGQQIRDLRNLRGITQDTLASQISVSRTSITNIEKGRQRLQLHTLYEIALVLDVELDELLPRKSEVSEIEDTLNTSEAIDSSEQMWIRSVIARVNEAKQ